MDRALLLARLRAHKHAVLATVAASGAPQAAIVGVSVADDLSLVFDTLGSTRKAANLRRDARVAFAFGGDDDAWTIQYEGRAEEPTGAALEAARALYFARFPDGRERLAWPGITHVRVRPTWIRHTSYEDGEKVDAFEGEALAAMQG
jgi:general stress protein 26